MNLLFAVHSITIYSSIMERLGLLEFTQKVDGVVTTVVIGSDRWTANAPTLRDAITLAFVNNLVNSEEACEALATERHMIPWRKPLRVHLHTLRALGFQLESVIQTLRTG